MTGRTPSAGVTSTINVASVNDVPALTAGATLNYTENQAATAIDTTVTVNDLDHANLTGATVQITGNYVNGQDVLAFVNTPNIIGVFSAATGTLTLTGSDTLANYQAALRAVTYFNTSDNPSVLARTVTFIANDGTNVSSAVTSTVNITPVNDAPAVAPNAGGAFTENTAAVDVAGSAVLTDVDSTNLTQVMVTLTNLQANDVLSMQTVAGLSGELANGVDFTITGGNVVTLTGGDNFAEYQSALQEVQFSNTSENPNTTARSFTIEANDGAAANNLGSANVNVSVTAINDTPVNTVADSQQVVHSFTPTAIVGLSVADVDAGSNIVTTLTADDGAIINIGADWRRRHDRRQRHRDGDADRHGRADQHLARRLNVSYTSADGFTGLSTVTISTNDNGQTGQDLV